jgi:hypothetical protein
MFLRISTRLHHHCVLLILLSFLSQPVFAQTTPEPVSLVPAKIIVSARAVTPMELPEGEPLAVNLQLWNFPGAPTGLDTNITLNGFARTVSVDDRRIAQVIITTISKDGRSATIDDDQGFVAQFDLESGVLKAGQEIDMEGSRDSLIEALQKLKAEPAQINISDEIVSDRVILDDEIETGNSTSPSDVGGNASSNDQASSWKAPTSVATKNDPTLSVVTTEVGCSVRIDDAQKVAIQQSKSETYEDGVLTNSSECSDSEIRYPLEQSYNTCGDFVDMAALTAWPQYTLYYTDKSGVSNTISTCQSDVDQPFTIYEDEATCAIYTNFAAGLAVPQSSLVYVNMSNVEQQVRGCEASTGNLGVPMVQTTDGCTIRHDYVGSTSYQQGAYVYELNGIQYQAGGCADSGLSYTQTVIYDSTAGGFLCSPVVNLSSGKATLQSRLQIIVDGMSQFITDCTPDTTSLNLTATTDGCDNPFTWQHDLSVGQSYGQERFYFLYNATPDYVTECQQSTVVYPHQVETTGWQDHDDQLYAYALTTVYIQLPTGRYDVAVSQVLPGATQMPYELSGTALKENGTVSYEDCSRFSETSNFEQWKRPDDTVYEKAIGTGAPIGPSNACSVTSWPSEWNLISNYVVRTKTNCGPQNKGYQARRYGTYEGVYTVTREDGVVITNSTATNNNYCSTGSYCYHTGSAEYNQWYPYPSSSIPANNCSATVGAPSSLNWNTSQGWTLY